MMKKYEVVGDHESWLMHVFETFKEKFRDEYVFED